MAVGPPRVTLPPLDGGERRQATAKSSSEYASAPATIMTSQPTCSVDGRHLRVGLLLAILAFLGYVLYNGFREGPSEREVFICDGDTSDKMVECSGLDDQSCASGAPCIRSSCGYKLFPHIDASVAGSSDPYKEDAATNPRSFVAVMSEFYSGKACSLFNRYFMHDCVEKI